VDDEARLEDRVLGDLSSTRPLTGDGAGMLSVSGRDGRIGTLPAAGADLRRRRESLT